MMQRNMAGDPANRGTSGTGFQGVNIKGRDRRA
jgi:hypothetical protein